MKKFNRVLEMILGVCVNSLGLYFMIKSGLGQTAFVSLSRNIAHLTNIKEGTMIMMFNISCTLINWMILRKEFKTSQCLQFLVAFLQGQVVNMMLYNIPVMKDIVPMNYYQSIAFILLGIILCSYGIGIVMNANIIKFPLEDLCMVISNKLDKEFSKVRQLADILFILGSISIILLCGFEWTTLREGTWICMLVLGPSTKYTFPLAKKYSLLIA